MGQMGFGYGSEWHLLRFLGRHRDALNRAIAQATNGLVEVRQWVDFHCSDSPPHDEERKGFDFLADEDLRSKWQTFWPQTGEPINWDAVAEYEEDGVTAWLLVEAKAHVEELKGSPTGAGNQSRRMIQEAMLATRLALNSDQAMPVADWLDGHYYQYANRLASLHFLNNIAGVPARLLRVYFLGDSMANCECPEREEGWTEAIGLIRPALGLSGQSELEGRVHKLFIDVNGCGLTDAWQTGYRR